MQWDDSAPDDAVRIPLRARDGSVRAYAIVDAADADWVNQWRWSLNGGYAHRCTLKNYVRRKFLMHRELMGLVQGDGLEVDHINRNKLDNRRANLRVVSKSEQAQNRPSIGKSSSLRGVSWSKQWNKWQVSITASGTRHFIGYFRSEKEAGAAAAKARKRLLPFAVD